MLRDVPTGVAPMAPVQLLGLSDGAPTSQAVKTAFTMVWSTWPVLSVTLAATASGVAASEIPLMVLVSMPVAWCTSEVIALTSAAFKSREVLQAASASMQSSIQGLATSL